MQRKIVDLDYKGIDMYRLKFFIVFTVALTVSMYITYFYSINNLMRVFTTPIFVCVTGYLILRDDFARKSARTALLISLLVCIVQDNLHRMVCCIQ